MPKKEDLLTKLLRKPSPSNFTTRELDALMQKCGCSKDRGGRGSGIRYIHNSTGRMIVFDGPHPGNELYRYHIKMVIAFLQEIGEI